MLLKNTICIPIVDWQGEIVSWCFRATEDSPSYQPRYFYTTGRSHATYLFGEYQARIAEVTEVVVTEGPIDAMWLWQAGMAGVAMFGTGNAANPTKVEKLSDFAKVTLFGDRDDAGAGFVGTLGSLLVRQTSCSVAKYRKGWAGTDPNTLTLTQVRWAVDHALPYHQWEMQNSLTRR
jgi:DNA primase